MMSARSSETPYEADAGALAVGREALRLERDAIERSSQLLGDDFVRAVDLVAHCPGKVVVTGLGKSGHVGAKIAATLSSVGSPAFFVHSVEALHGDSGALSKGDVLIALSNSGRTAETVALARYAATLGVEIISIVGVTDSPLAQLSAAVLDASVEREADPLGLAPTASTTVAIAIGDALAAAAMTVDRFTPADFHARHPSGSLGEDLAPEVRS